MAHKPHWLKIRLPSVSEYAYLKGLIKEHGLHTICESGRCPNLAECWAARTATFMILGGICTRNCRFCNVEQGKPLPPLPGEPEHIASVVKKMGIKHCVLTSVTRDDLEDGGASIWAETIRAVKSRCPGTTVEALIPDFNGDIDLIRMIADEKPDIISHNLETVRRLSPVIRPMADYCRSLEVLRAVSSFGIISKSGIMAGLGETDEEIEQTMDDLLEVSCRILTIGQYLQPRKGKQKVERYVSPEQFEMYKKTALQKGFYFAECNPLVRSSYHSQEHLAQMKCL